MQGVLPGKPTHQVQFSSPAQGKQVVYQFYREVALPQAGKTSRTAPWHQRPGLAEGDSVWLGVEAFPDGYLFAFREGDSCGYIHGFERHLAHLILQRLLGTDERNFGKRSSPSLNKESSGERSKGGLEASTCPPR